MAAFEAMDAFGDATEPFSPADASMAFGPPGYETSYRGPDAMAAVCGFAEAEGGMDLYGSMEPLVGGEGGGEEEEEEEEEETVEARRYEIEAGDAGSARNASALFVKVWPSVKRT